MSQMYSPAVAAVKLLAEPRDGEQAGVTPRATTASSCHDQPPAAGGGDGGRKTPSRVATDRSRAIGMRLKHRRLEMRFSQEDMAGVLGVTKGLISQYENGLVRIPADKIEILSDLLAVTPDWLLTGGIPENNDVAQNPVEVEVLRTLRAIKPVRHAMVLRFLEVMREEEKRDQADE